MAPPRASAPVPFVLPQLASQPAPLLRCAASPAPAAQVVKVYTEDHSAIVVDASADPGPRLRDLGPHRFRRTRDQIRRAVSEQASDHINRCWRAVRFGARPPAEEELALDTTLTIDVSGAVTAAQVGPAGKLADCVAAGLRAVHLRSATARTTEVAGTVQLWASGVLTHPGKRVKPPAFPPAPKPAASSSCTGVPGDVPVDRIAIGEIAAVGDWDDEHYARQVEESRRTNRATAIDVPRDCATAVQTSSKAFSKAVVRSNLGAYRSCYRAARARTPDLAGDLNVAIHFERGRPQVAKLSPLGDDAFQRCMTDALAELEAYPVRPHWQNSESHFILRFDPATPAATTVRAPDTCDGQLDILRATLAATATPGDPRVTEAALALARTASANMGCAAAAVDSTRALLWPLRTADQRPAAHAAEVAERGGHEEAERRAELLLAAWPDHPERDALVALRARSLLEESHRDQALALVPAGGRWGEWLRTLAPETAQPTHMHGRCE